MKSVNKLIAETYSCQKQKCLIRKKKKEENTSFLYFPHVLLMTIFTKSKNDYFTKISRHLMVFLAPNAHSRSPGQALLHMGKLRLGEAE